MFEASRKVLIQGPLPADKVNMFEGFFKEMVRYPVWTCCCREPISLFLETRFSLILRT